MFYEWVAAGAIFGIKAFFALAVFAIFCCALIGLLAVLAYIAKGEREDG